jgi:Fe-S cluster assembly scaffold IscU
MISVRPVVFTFLRSFGSSHVSAPLCSVSLVRSLRSNSSFRSSYHTNVIDHYNNPRNVGKLDPKDPSVGTGIVGAPACGDVMKLQIRVDSKSGIIEDVKFKTFGCGSAIASSSFASEWAKGKHIEDVVAIKNSDIAKHLSLPPVKLHCSMLAEDAIKAAYADYKKKRDANEQENKVNQTQ